jgi:inner membrane protein
MTWWIWAVLGIFLLGVELLSPGGFFVFFFGVGALVVGLAAAIYPPLSQNMQLALFPLVSVVLLIIFRSHMQELFHNKPNQADVDTLQGSVCVATDEIAPNNFGKVETRGTVWSARNIGALSVGKGERCIIQKVEGLLLQITREETV